MGVSANNSHIFAYKGGDDAARIYKKLTQATIVNFHFQPVQGIKNLLRVVQRVEAVGRIFKAFYFVFCSCIDCIEQLLVVKSREFISCHSRVARYSLSYFFELFFKVFSPQSENRFDCAKKSHSRFSFSLWDG